MTGHDPRPMPSFPEQVRILIRALYRHRLLAGALGATVFAAFFLYALLAPKQYAAGSTMMTQSDTSLSTLPSLASDSGAGLPGLSLLKGGAAPLDYKLLNLLRSRDLFFRVAEKSDLLKILYEDKWDAEAGTWEEGFTPVLDEAYHTRWGKVFDAFVDEETYSVKFKILTPYPQKSHDIATTILNELQSLLNEKTSGTATHTRIFLEQRLAQIDREMAGAEEALRNFQVTNQIYLPDSQIAGVLDLVTTLESQRMANEIQLGVLSRYAQETNPKIKAIRDEIDEIDAKIEEIRSGKPKQKGVAAQAPLLPPLEATPELMQKYLQLKRQVMVFEKLKSLLMAEYEFAKLKEQKEDLSVIVIDSPTVPARKAKPKRTLIVLAGIFMAAFVASGAALTAEYAPAARAWVRAAAHEDEGETD